MLKRDQIKDTKVFCSEDFVTQYKPLLFDFRIRKVLGIDSNVRNVLSRKVQKLDEDSIKSDVRSSIWQFTKRCDTDVSVKSCRKIQGGRLLQSVEKGNNAEKPQIYL